MSTQLPPPPPQETQPPKKHSWVALMYFYVAALIGVIIVITGALIAVNSFVEWMFFDQPEARDGFYGSHEDRDDKLQTALQGVLTAAVGAPLFWWHLREARNRDG